MANENAEEVFYVGEQEFTTEQYMIQILEPYIQENQTATNTKLFSILALLNAYVPESYLLMPQCQQILGPPDPIYGGPPFEERMSHFTIFISTANGHISFINQWLANFALNHLQKSNISRSAIARQLMDLLCGNNAEPYVVEYLKVLLTKREEGNKGKDRFSKLVHDITKHEGLNKALTLLKIASERFPIHCSFPQVLARLYYIEKKPADYGKAEKWAKKAIQIAPRSSYMADTLGQIYKHRLLKTTQRAQVPAIVKRAYSAFEDVEMKAAQEENPVMKGEGVVNTSTTFNNRGLFGFMQVAKTAHEKLQLIKDKRIKVESTFKFFEWYLTFSKMDMDSVEPRYFWKDVSLCYERYTGCSASESTSFSGLLELLNRGLYTSKGHHAGFQEDVVTASDLEMIQRDLQAKHQNNAHDIEIAERYILSNIILSHRNENSPCIRSISELRAIIQTFADINFRSPKFYLLALLLFWPEMNEGEKAAEQHRDQLLVNPVLQQYVQFMEAAYERDEFAKYLRGRYLVPLFFLGKQPGLKKWIHKSILDRIVEDEVNTELHIEEDTQRKTKLRYIDNKWINGTVWGLPEVQDILQPVSVEPLHPYLGEQEHQEVFIVVGGRRIIKTFTQFELNADDWGHMRFYLGFSIKGPVLFELNNQDFEGSGQ